ncbi:MAG: AMP-binding protein [Kiloniellales bacterium]
MPESAVRPYYPQDGVSLVAGPKEPSLWERTVPEILADSADRYGEREALVFADRGLRLTYKAFARSVDELAAGLVALGIEKGDRVGIWSPNKPEWVMTQFATARIGAILVTINPAYRLSELEFALNKVQCKALVTADRFKSSDYLSMLRELAPELDSCAAGALESERLPSLRCVIRTGSEETAGMFTFDAVLARGSAVTVQDLDKRSAALSVDEAINIQFTSGTTGTPKGATLTHRNIANNGRLVVGTQHLGPGDRLCIPVPLYHCFGMVMGTLGSVTAGATMVFAGEAFDPLATLDCVAKEACTALYGVPTMFVAMLEHPEFSAFDLSSLRTGIMAGAPCPIEVMKRVIADMNMAGVTIAYGMTETSPVSFQSHTDDPLERRVSTVGRVHPHVEVKVIGSDGAILPTGERGELCTRGYSVMKGYWDEPERTAEVLDDDGWMHSGDQAVIDAEGYCEIVGRVKDMLIRGGENVYPREVEDFLYRHPKVQQVQVFGVSDAKFGEEVCAWIVLKPEQKSSEEEIRSFCQGQIAHYKIPRYVRFKDELPMTVTGKPQKFKMRDAMEEELAKAD